MHHNSFIYVIKPYNTIHFGCIYVIRTSYIQQKYKYFTYHQKAILFSTNFFGSSVCKSHCFLSSCASAILG